MRSWAARSACWPPQCRDHPVGLRRCDELNSARARRKVPGKRVPKNPGTPYSFSAWFKNMRLRVTLSGKAPLDTVCVSAPNTIAYAKQGLGGAVRKCYPGLNHPSFSLDESGRSRQRRLPEAGAVATIEMKAGHYAHRRPGPADLLDRIETARPCAGRRRLCGEAGAAPWAPPGPGKPRPPAQGKKNHMTSPEFPAPAAVAHIRCGRQ